MPIQKKLEREEAEHVLRYSFNMDMDRYLRWCEQAGFPVTWHKPWWQFKKELKKYRDHVAARELERSSRATITDREAIHRFIDNPKRDDFWGHHRVAGLLPSFKHLTDESKEALLSLVDEVSGKDGERTKILKDADGIRMLVRMAMWSPYWVRHPETWKVGSHSLQRQRASLVRHLLAKYPVPSFMDSAWEGDWGGGDGQDTEEKSLHQEWYVHVGQGANIRTARMLPFPLTKKMAHLFLEAPGDFSIPEALVHGQVLAVGGTSQMSRAFRGTRVMSLDDEFRQSFVRFLAENPLLDRRQYGPILDYICHVKYEPTQVVDAQGGLVPGDPLQPNFSMAGRSANALMEQVERWHRELGRSKRTKSSFWRHSAVQDFRLDEGQGDNRKTWTVVELTTSDQLFDEGRAMKHCVASYAGSCEAGRCTIWSLRLYDSMGGWRRGTLEVEKRKIVEARSAGNLPLGQQDWRIVRLWMQKNSLQASSWLMV